MFMTFWFRLMSSLLKFLIILKRVLCTATFSNLIQVNLALILAFILALRSINTLYLIFYFSSIWGSLLWQIVEKTLLSFILNTFVVTYFLIRNHWWMMVTKFITYTFFLLWEMISWWSHQCKFAVSLWRDNTIFLQEWVILC